jgi:hypothetical protein
MGTKNEPGKFDCYAAAGNDEPMFVLLGRDPVAPFVIFAWVALRIEAGDDEDEKLTEAVSAAAKMHLHAAGLGKGETLALAAAAFSSMLDGGVSPDELAEFFAVALVSPEKVVEALRQALFAPPSGPGREE